MRRATAKLAGLLALVASSVGFAACGGSGEADLANGKQKFAACGGCHAMSDAGTTATVGPNLDDAFRAARTEGFDPDSFRGVVRYWIANPEQRSEPLMPPNLVTGKDAEDVAAYVAAVAGTDKESPPRAAEPVEPPAPAQEAASGATTGATTP
jgi:cytochrome c551/c552